jgi:hypothetical protein
VDASAGTGGSITPDGAVSAGVRHRPGVRAVSAADCYSIADVAVDGGSIGAVTGYTFSNVHGDHTIAVRTFSLNGPYTIDASAGSAWLDLAGGEVFDACGADQPFTVSRSAERLLLDRGRRGRR